MSVALSGVAGVVRFRVEAEFRSLHFLQVFQYFSVVSCLSWGLSDNLQVRHAGASVVVGCCEEVIAGEAGVAALVAPTATSIAVSVGRCNLGNL
jgi:hypothetical protein